MTRLPIIILLVACLGAIIGYLLLPPALPVSPLGDSTLLVSTVPQTRSRVLGFLPYWNMKKLGPTSLSHVTNLAYFALELDSQGEIVTMSNNKEEHPGWTGFKKFVTDPRFTPLHQTLVIQVTDEDDIDQIVSSPLIRTRAINNILDLSVAHSFQGLNLDFEPSGEVSSKTRDNFTQFVEELSLAISKRHLSNFELSVDIYPTIVGKSRLWDLPRISPHLNYFVIMGYDYHYRGSETAGPVSPLRGATQFFNNDLITNLGEISNLLPSNKIVLAVPFYGYRWVTTTNDKYSTTIGSGVTTPISDIEDIVSASPSALRWDYDSLTPYLVLEKNHKISQIYFDNEVSLGLKLDLVRDSSYQGIAIWALGYEGSVNSLWQTIKEKLQ